MADLERQLKDYRPTTAEILYHMPDFPTVLQTFVWQRYDLAPRFPTLNRFLHYWTENLDGALHSVRVANASLITTSELRFVDGEFRLH